MFVLHLDCFYFVEPKVFSVFGIFELLSSSMHIENIQFYKLVSFSFLGRCCCGQPNQTHTNIPGIEPGSPGDIWISQKHTRSHPTDAYGTIEFQGGTHPTKAQVHQPEYYR